MDKNIKYFLKPNEREFLMDYFRTFLMIWIIWGFLVGILSFVVVLYLYTSFVLSFVVCFLGMSIFWTLVIGKTGKKIYG